MKTIKLELFQAEAHFREPKVLNTDLITSLPLTPPTTIAGMLAHVYGQRFREPLDVGIVGKYESVKTDFQRIEKSEWFEDFIKDSRSRAKKISGQPDYPDYIVKSFREYKKLKHKQGVSTFEILQEGRLTVFIKSQSMDTLTALHEALQNPSYYPSLGRKEDYVEIKSVEIVDIEENVSISQKEAIVNDYILKNTYVPVDLKSDDPFFDAIAEVGTLFVIPKIYKSIDAHKRDREYLHQHYIYVGDNSRYLGGTFNRYEKTIFHWLVQIQEQR